jgi:hypothetical protein
MMQILRENWPVLVAAARTPFLESAGAYSELMSYEVRPVKVLDLATSMITI